MWKWCLSSESDKLRHRVSTKQARTGEYLSGDTIPCKGPCRLLSTPAKSWNFLYQEPNRRRKDTYHQEINLKTLPQQ